jgi:hypothetical protein
MIARESLGAMKRLAIGTVLLTAAAAWAGHELPIYPSFYPHEIEIRTIAPGAAAIALRDGKLHAYVGPGLTLTGALPDPIGVIESLGAFFIVRINSQSGVAKDHACAAAGTVVRALGQDGFVPHPYPVTPFHGDYLHHADLADAAKARLAQADSISGLKIKASAAMARQHPEWSAQPSDWDAEVLEIDAAGLIATDALVLNGLIAPPWLKMGWYNADRLLADATTDPVRKQRIDTDRARLTRGDYSGLAERINLERDLVSALTQDCQATVAGYTIKREYINADFSAGIENVGYDAIMGLHSPMFLRTVKLKDFPWNGWLALGTPARPASAWNPIGGLNDPFGQLVGFAVTDPALLPSPYEAGWMLNRIADLPTTAGR